MKKGALNFIIISLLFVGAAICLNIYSKEIENSIQEECVHDWVITSRYNILTNNYRTISKCSKCGKEVK